MALELEVWQAPIVDNEGNIQPGAQVTVFNSDDTIATIYDDLNRTPRSNPFNVGSDALARFYAEPGRYRVQAQVGSDIAVFDDVDLSQKSVRSDIESGNQNVLGVSVRRNVISVDSIQELRDLPASARRADLTVLLGDNPTGSGVFKWKVESEKTDNGVLFITPNGVGGSAGRWERVGGSVDQSCSVLVPSDYPDLQSVFNDLTGKVNFGRSVSINVIIESGYTITSTTRLDRHNYSGFAIQSEDDVVNCVLPTAEDDLFQFWSYCHGPSLQVLFDMGGTGRTGLFVVNNSRAFMPPARVKPFGIRNAGARNVYAYRGSWVSIGSKQDSPDIPADFSGAGTDCIFSQRGSWVFANNCDISGAGEYGAHCRHGSHLVVNECDIRNSGLVSLQATAGGFISAFGSLIDPDSWSVTPNTISSPSGIILTDQSAARGLGVVIKSGNDQEGSIVYSDGSIKAWKYIEVDSTNDTNTQMFTMPVPLVDFSKIYLSGARGNATSPVVGSDVVSRSRAAASVVYGFAGGGNLGVRVTEANTSTTNTIIGYMAVVDIPAV